MVVKEMPLAGGDTFTLDTEKVVLEVGDKVTVLFQAILELEYNC